MYVIGCSEEVRLVRVSVNYSHEAKIQNNNARL